MLQVTNKHVMDLAWSPDGEFFIAGSTDNTATIWKASTGWSSCAIYALTNKASVCLPFGNTPTLYKVSTGTLSTSTLRHKAATGEH